MTNIKEDTFNQDMADISNDFHSHVLIGSSVQVQTKKNGKTQYDRIDTDPIKLRVMKSD